MRDLEDPIAGEVLPHASRPESRRGLVAGTSIALASFVAGLFLLMPPVLSTFESMFKGVGATLPGPTQAILGVPDIVWIAIGLVAGVAIVSKDRMVSPGVARALDTVILFAAGVFVAGTVAALFVPLLEIIRTIE